MRWSLSDLDSIQVIYADLGLKRIGRAGRSLICQTLFGCFLGRALDHELLLLLVLVKYFVQGLGSRTCELRAVS